MSILGRNHHRGSPVQWYRKTDTTASGGLTNRAWSQQGATSLAIMTTTDAVARRVFGEETDIDATAVIDVGTDIQREDAIIVLSGEHALRRFWVASARPLRRFVELGLTSMPDAVDLTIPVTVS